MLLASCCTLYKAMAFCVSMYLFIMSQTGKDSHSVEWDTRSLSSMSDQASLSAILCLPRSNNTFRASLPTVEEPPMIGHFNNFPHL